jgi:hypothetical protein
VRRTTRRTPNTAIITEQLVRVRLHNRIRLRAGRSRRRRVRFQTGASCPAGPSAGPLPGP